MPDLHIAEARFPADTETVRTLFQEYAAGLGLDLAFQGFAEELAALPGKYAAPAGCVLIAWQAGTPVGCVALRPRDAAICEMKRLYLRSAARGQGLGRALVLALCERARERGYARMRLDTLPSMTAARVLYYSLGFAPIAPYIFNPVPGTEYLELDLAGPLAH